MRKILYSKYNQSRAPRYQTRTIICRDEDRTYIEKSAVTAAAKQHLDNFKVNYSRIQDIYPRIQIIETEFGEDVVRYPYLQGKGMDEYLKENVTSWDGMFVEMKKLIAELYSVNPEYQCEFERCAEFSEIFGDFDCSGMKCVKPCNLDVIFDNLMVMEDDKIIAFDYEWVFDFAVPERYVIYRLLCHFYDKYFGYISPKYSFDAFIDMFEFSDDEKHIFRQMEDAFIRHVYTGGEPAFAAEQYRIARPEFAEISRKFRDYDNVVREYQNTVDNLQNTLDILHNTENEYLLTIDRLNEAAGMVGQLNNELQSANARLAEMYRAYDDLINSKSWKITKPMRWVRQGTISLRQDGVKATAQKMSAKISRKIAKPAYADTAVSNDVPDNVATGQFVQETEMSAEEADKQRNTVFGRAVKISVITPLFNTPEKYLIDLLESLKAQTYSNWELCMVNFSDSEHQYVDEICRRYAENDSRYVYHVGTENRGISENTNECISYAGGEYIGLLDHDDILHPSALYEAAKAINEQNCDFIYTDEIKFEEDVNKGFAPNFKPDFSMDELRAHNYICHFCVYSKALYDKVGEYRKEFDGSQDHDIVLRLTEQAEKIVHIPKILYFWRVHPGSVASSIDAKSYATDAGAAAVTEQLRRYGNNQYAESIINNIPLYRIKSNEQADMALTVVIWGAKEPAGAEKCRQMLVQSGLNNARFVIVSNDDVRTAEKDDVRIIQPAGRTFGACFNEVMKYADTQYVLFVNAAVQSISEGMLKEIALYANRDDIGTVDVKVVSDERMVSGGVYVKAGNELSFGVRCMNADKGYNGYENALMHTRNVSASLGLFTFVSKNTWEILGGFSEGADEESVMEFSYRALEKGYNNVWIPFISCCGDIDKYNAIVDNILQKSVGGEGQNGDRYVSQKVFDYGLE